MSNVSPKPFLFALLGLSALVWFAFLAIDGLDANQFLQFIRPIPKVVAVDAVFVFCFLKWGWRWKALRGVLVPFPDLNGTWQGHLQTTWKDDGGKRPGAIPVVLTIKQTFASISCVMRTAEMSSHSYAEGFSIEEDRQVRRLSYCYVSSPKITVRGRSTPHDGAVTFRIVERPDRKLLGTYWTQRGTTGEIDLSYVSPRVIETLPPGLPAHPVAS